MTATMSLLPVWSKMMSDAVPGGPVGGVVWLRGRSLAELTNGIRPRHESMVKQLPKPDQSVLLRIDESRIYSLDVADSSSIDYA